MVFSRNKFILTFVIMIFVVFFAVKNSFAWDGYDYENNAAVEIGTGNLVREGEVITFFDWETEEEHRAEVKSVESAFNGTRLEVYDLNEEKDRVLNMQY